MTNAIKSLMTLSFLLVAVQPAVSLATESPWEVEYGFEGNSDGDKNAKFNEYQYKREDKLGFFMSLQRKVETPVSGASGRFDKLNPFRSPAGGTRYLNFLVKGRAPEEGDISIQSGVYGHHTFAFDVRRIGHNFATNARTLYSGNATGSLTLADNIQSTLQQTATDTVGTLRGFLNTQGFDIDIRLKRDKYKMEYQRIFQDRPMTLNLFMDHEQREGSRPYGGSEGGHSNFVEIPEPIDYGTTNMGANIEYAEEGRIANLSYKRSFFNNRIPSVSYENLFRTSDHATAGELAGRNALHPDNTYDNVTLLLAGPLPQHAHARARLSHGWMRQEDALLPFSNNTVIANYVKAFPTSQAHNKVETRLYDMAVSMPVTERLHLGANFLYDQHENKSPVYTCTAYIRDDAAVATGGETTTYVSSTKRMGEFEAEFEINDMTSMGLTYEIEDVSFRNGSASREHDNVYEMTLNRRHSSGMSRLILERSKKETAYPNYPKYAVEVPWLRKYYAAARTRTQLVAMTSVSPGDKMALNFHYIFGKDDYKASRYGLQDDKHSILSVDMDYEWSDRTSFSLFYSFEQYKLLQRSHAWSAGTPTDPHTYPDTYSQAASWNLLRRDRWHTAGFGMQTSLIADVLSVKLSGSYSIVDGLADFNSPVGASAALDGNRFEPIDLDHVDETKHQLLDIAFLYQMKTRTRSIPLTLGYRWDKWRIDDWQMDGVMEVPATATGGYQSMLNMNTLAMPYGGVHTAYASVAYDF